MKHWAWIVCLSGLIACDGDEGSSSPETATEDSAETASEPGRWIVFSSLASDLVPVDTNEVEDVFVYNRIAEKISRVSVSSLGTQGNGPSSAPSISADGRYVAFQSTATNLTPEGKKGIFLHDRSTGQTRILCDLVWSQGPSVSADGRFVAYAAGQIYLYEILSGQTSLVSVNDAGEQADKGCDTCSLSADGRFVAFRSSSTNLRPQAPGDSTSNVDIYVRDRELGKTLYVTADTEGNQGNEWSHEPVISHDGRWVAFSSYASDLVADDTNGVIDVFVRDLVDGETYLVGVALDGGIGDMDSSSPAMSSDGRILAFVSSSTNLVPSGGPDGFLYVRDQTLGETTRIDTSNYVRTPSLSADGRYLTWGEKGADGAYGIVLRDLQTGEQRWVTRATDSEWLHETSEEEVVRPGDAPALSADGRFLAFVSDLPDLVPGDTNGLPDVFLYDRDSQQITRLSVANDGTQADGGSWSPAISADGRIIAFASYATNLVAVDKNLSADIFLYDRELLQLSRVVPYLDSPSFSGLHSWAPSLSADGRYVAFASASHVVASGDTNGCTDVFVHDRIAVQTSRVSVQSDGDQVAGNSWGPAISGDGRYVAFVSDSIWLVPGDTNQRVDVFLHDRTTGATSRVNAAASNGDSWAPAISHDGRYVAFSSWASNLATGDVNGRVDVFLTDRETGQTSLIAAGWAPSMSGDGRFVAFASDGGIHRFDRLLGTLVCVGDGEAPSVSEDGCYVSYFSAGKTVLFDAESESVVELAGNADRRAGNDHSSNPRIR